jgi:hypothetical protein
MCEGAGGNCPPHFEKLRVTKLNCPLLALNLRKTLFYLEWKHINVLFK